MPRVHLELTSFLAMGLFVLTAHVATAQPQSPADIVAGACTQAPRIDGHLEPGEWDAAACHPFSMAMVSTGGAAPARQAELRVMNSATNLYVALRIPDAERQASFSPLKCDLVLLVFAKGTTVAANDDRKILIPGAYVDKHVVTPGKDADDAQRDGQGALAWADGEYVAEFGFPLRSGDAQDLSAQPGDRVRFNLVYADAFAADLTGTQFGGLFSASADDASGWGYLVLADKVGKEAQAPDPEWLVRLFPHTGEPDECVHRFRRLAASEIAVGNDLGGQVTCEFLHRDIAGRTQKAQARIFLPPQLRRAPTTRVPLVCNAGYELEAGGATGLLAKGWAVSTPHAQPLNPLVRGPNLDIALLHAARALACTDKSRVMIQGGSAGGYMTLMLAAETFPLVCALPGVPPVNWGYNAAYLRYNRDVANAVQPGGTQAAMPVVKAVIPIADGGVDTMGPDTDADSWLLSSPISQLECFSAPLLVLWSTGDMLVPVDQIAAQFVRARRPELFPERFTTAIETLMRRPETRARLLDVLPADAYETFLVTVPANAPILAPNQGASGPPVPVVLPFSKERVWSIVILDEGAPEPDAGHFRHALSPDQEPFRQWACSRGLSPDQATVPKLRRLMLRLQGKEYHPFNTRLAAAAEPIPAVRLDFAAAERQDVLEGLLAFAVDPICAERLAECYGQLPRDLRALGTTLGETAAEIRSRLTQALAKAPSR